MGAGVTISEIITTTNITGPVYEEVLTASGVVESGYKAVALTKAPRPCESFLPNPVTRSKWSITHGADCHRGQFAGDNH